MTVLSQLQTLMRKKGMPVPTAIVGATDATFQQLRALAEEAVEYLRTMPWQQESSRVTATAVAGSDQGTLASLFGADLCTFDPNSLWDVTQNKPILGPVDSTHWQILRSQPAGGPEYVYRIMGDHLHVWPEMAGTETISAIVQSKWIVRDAGGAAKAQITADDDTFSIPEEVFRKQVEWRWLKEKGEPWTAAFEESRALTAGLLAFRAAQPRLQLDTTAPVVSPGIYIPSGSWSV